MPEFEDDVARRIAAAASNTRLRASADAFLVRSVVTKYSYNFFWLGV